MEAAAVKSVPNWNMNWLDLGAVNFANAVRRRVMWDLLKIRKKLDECGRLRDALEGSAETAALSRAQQAHLAACPQCQAVVDDIVMSRALLREVPARAALPGPWFAPRVMAAIAV